MKKTQNKPPITKHLNRFVEDKLYLNPIFGLVIIAGVALLGAYYLLGVHAASPYVVSDAASGTRNSNANIVTDPTAASGSAVQFGSAPSGGSGSGMSAPTGFNSSELLMDDQFGNASGYSLFKNWNFGVTENVTSGNSCTEVPWGESGTAPYYSSGGGSGGTDAEDWLPQQVSQTSTGDLNDNANNSFSSTGSGLTITAQYDNQGNGYTWAAGAINTYGKVQIGGNGGNYFVQVRAQMPYAEIGGAHVDNGAWAGIWLLPGCGNTTDGLNLGTNQDAETDMNESGYTSLSTVTTTLHQGGSYDSGNQCYCQQNQWTAPVDTSVGYNVYGLDINEATDTDTFYFNGQPYETYSDATTGPMFLIINFQVASAATNGWHEQIVSNSYSEQLNVSEVQMYSSLK